MKREELFLAIGFVENSRLLRSEMGVSSPETEETKMFEKKVRPGRITRNLLIAAIAVSMLAVTAFAATGFLLYENPQKMISAIFGDNTGFDHSEGSIKSDPMGPPSGVIVEPTYDRVPVDPTVVEEDVVPHVDIVGRSISFNGYTLTVDAFMYDSNTKCGFFTYQLENPAGVSGYKLQSNGELWYEGMPDVVDVNQYRETFIIREKTSDTCLAATCYFKSNERRGENLEITLQSQKRYTPEEFEVLIAADVEKRKQEMSPEEVVAAVRKRLGEENFEKAYQGLTEEETIKQCYLNLVAWETSERLETEGTSEMICVPLDENLTLKHITAGENSIVITSISTRIDITDLPFLHVDRHGNKRVHTDNIDSVVIRYKDGTEYTVVDGYTINYNFGISELPEENVQTEVFVSPEEDPNGEGYVYVENSHEYCLLTMMFNRIIDIDNIASVIINGRELPVD